MGKKIRYDSNSRELIDRLNVKHNEIMQESLLDLLRKALYLLTAQRAAPMSRYWLTRAAIDIIMATTPSMLLEKKVEKRESSED